MNDDPKRRGPYGDPSKPPPRDRKGEAERREKGEKQKPGRKPGGKNKQEPGSY